VVIEYDLDGEPTLIGLRADKVHEVTTIDRDDTEEAPASACAGARTSSAAWPAATAT
jgi:chemotaxis signal transduction protein